MNGDGAAILGVVWLFVLITTIWLTYDARVNKVPIDKKPYSLNNGALAWFFSSVLLWIGTFPYYLVRRSQVLRDRAQGAVSSSSVTAAPHDELRRLKSLVDDRVITREDFERKKKQLLGV